MARRRRKRKGHYHRGTYESTKGGACSYRSGWELSYIKHLDGDPEVASFEYEGLKIPYVSNVRSGRTRNYIPDFLVTYVSGDRKLVEVKPKKRLSQPKVQKKLKAAQAWCQAHDVTLVVLTEVELRPMGLLA